MAEHDRTVPFYQEIEGCILPGGFSADAFKDALAYKPLDDDFFIATFPKCGTTWTQQIVYLIYNKGKPPKNWLDFFYRTPFLEMFGRESGEQMPRPGAIKTHLPFHLTPYSKKAKYLYVVRNPKDTAVSFYHHMITDALFTFQEGTFERYFEDFMTGGTVYGDYFKHVLGWYEHRDDPNVMFVMYEELKKESRNTVLKIAKFMGDEWFDILANGDSVLDDVLKYSSFDYMKDMLNSVLQKEEVEPPELGIKMAYPGLIHTREFSNKHRKASDDEFQLVRKGKVGGWRDVMSQEQIRRLDERIDKELKDTHFYDYWKKVDCL